MYMLTLEVQPEDGSGCTSRNMLHEDMIEYVVYRNSINELNRSCVRLCSTNLTPIIILSKHNGDVSPENLLQQFFRLSLTL
jgi:hypothetical protein